MSNGEPAVGERAVTAAPSDRAPAAGAPGFTVVICAYTLDRWDLLCAAVASVQQQTVPPQQVIVCVDHNVELHERCVERWGGRPTRDGPVAVEVVQNRYAGRLGSARTTAGELATGELIAFLDDDAAAAPDWLQRLAEAFADPGVVAVGGAPLPVFSRPRPRWFPPEYDWVFGCAYVGLPTTTAPIRHLIGANMAVRTASLRAIGYFHSDNHDDMDMSHRLRDQAPESELLYQPSAIVHHHVHAERLTWRYFWRRCFHVNRGKVTAFRDMGSAGNLQAERQFARRALTEGVTTGMRDFVGGDRGGLERAVVLCLGVGLAGLGYSVGTVEWHFRRLAGGRRATAPVAGGAGGAP